LLQGLFKNHFPNIPPAGKSINVPLNAGISTSLQLILKHANVEHWQEVFILHRDSMVLLGISFYSFCFLFQIKDSAHQDLAPEIFFPLPPTPVLGPRVGKNHEATFLV